MNRYKGGGLFSGVFGSCGNVFGHVFFSSRKVSCCSLQIEIYCWKSVMLVTASSAKHFLVAPILSIMCSDCTGETHSVIWSLRGLVLWILNVIKVGNTVVTFHTLNESWERWFNSCWEIQTISAVC